MERFVVHRPHPWGALVTFIELLRNPKYDFWSTSFVRAAPEVTLLLDSVGQLLSTPDASLHACSRLPDPSLYLKRMMVLLSVHHLSHLLLPLHFQAVTSRTVLYSHTAIIILLSTIWTLFRITVDTHLYSAYRSSYVLLMLPRHSTVIFPRASPKSVNRETLGADSCVN